MTDVPTQPDPPSAPEPTGPDAPEEVNEPASPPPNQAAPGPHPHEADPTELGIAAGTDTALPEGVEAFAQSEAPTLPTDPSTAAPGPHPHEARDHRRLGGLLKDLPAGVERFVDRLEGHPEPTA